MFQQHGQCYILCWGKTTSQCAISLGFRAQKCSSDIQIHETYQINK